VMMVAVLDLSLESDIIQLPIKKDGLECEFH
jgi:hypothetical protein